MIAGDEFEYLGELNLKNEAYGEGTARNDQFTLKVMMMHDKLHGLCKLL